VADPLLQSCNATRRGDAEEHARSDGRHRPVDPYSTNPVLQEKLGAVAQATFVGNLSMGIAVGAVIGPAQYAVDFDQTTRDAAWDLSPNELKSRNEKALADIGITGQASDMAKRQLAMRGWKIEEVVLSRT
jgi:hypothetical protein